MQSKHVLLSACNLVMADSGMPRNAEMHPSQPVLASLQEDPFLFAVYLGISLVLVLMAGLMSGLTLGLMSLDMVELEVCPVACDKLLCF